MWLIHTPLWKASPSLPPKVYLFELSPTFVPYHSTYITRKEIGFCDWYLQLDLIAKNTYTKIPKIKFHVTITQMTLIVDEKKKCINMISIL
jgi:hypothetical protein